MATRITTVRFGPGMLTLLVALSSLGAQPVRGEPTKVALLVGVNHSSMRLFGQNSPQCAERDVQELAAVLREQGFVVRALVGRVATKENIEAALSAVAQGRTAKDVV